MKKIVAILIAGFAIAGCSSTQTKQASQESESPRKPASASGDVSLKGRRAAEMIALIEKVEAVTPGSADCGMGTCGEERQIAVNCQYPNGPNPKKRMTCSVSGLDGKKSVSFTGLKARQLAGLLEAVKTVEEDESPCGMGSCFEQGNLAVSCTYRNGSGGNENCDVSALKK